MSSTIPSVDDRPAKQCPPPRGAMRSPVAVAYVMAPTTSETERHATTSRGRTSR